MLFACTCNFDTSFHGIDKLGLLRSILQDRKWKCGDIKRLVDNGADLEFQGWALSSLSHAYKLLGPLGCAQSCTQPWGWKDEGSCRWRSSPDSSPKIQSFSKVQRVHWNLLLSPSLRPFLPHLPLLSEQHHNSPLDQTNIVGLVLVSLFTMLTPRSCQHSFQDTFWVCPVLPISTTTLVA